MKFSSDFLDKVREASDIIEVIGEHVELQRAGASFRGRCPFPSHAERTASFFVSEVKQVYHCFGCQKSGNVFRFLMDYSGMTFPEAVSALAERAHIALPKPVMDPQIERAQEQSQKEYKLLIKLSRYVGAYFHKNLLSKSQTHPVQLYLKKRNLSQSTVEEFKLGYSENVWHSLSEFLIKAQAPMEQAQRLGLVKTRSDKTYYDIFRNRLIFPILSTTGQVLGFGGRSIDDSEPKYLNSPESPLFSKGKTLYGLHLTAKYIRASGEVLLVEGYMDLIALYQAGVKNVAATLGTAFTRDHAKIISKLCHKAVVLFDSDKAGIQAAEKSLEVFSQEGILSRWLKLRGAKDPDEYIQKFGVQKFLEDVKLAPDHFSAYLGQKLEGYHGRNTQKVEILSNIRPLLANVKDQQLRTLYAQEVAERLNLDTREVLNAKLPKHSQPSEITREIKNKKSIASAPKDEKLLVQFMLEKKEYVELMQEAGVIDSFFDENAQRLAHKIVEKYCQNPNDFDKLPASLLTYEGENKLGENNPESVPGGEQELLEELVFQLVDSRPKNKADEQKLVMDCIGRVKQRWLKAKSRELLMTLKSEQGTDATDESLKKFYEMAKEQKGPQRR